MAVMKDHQKKHLKKRNRSAKEQRTAIEQPLKNRYITGLDGLRAIAVLAVIAYHLNFDWAAGGLLGVTVFFVFLVT
jgi:uncharacterized membrane protein